MVVITLPISTTNITGFLTCTRGSSFLNDSGIAPRMILGSQIEMAPLRRVFHCLISNSSVRVLVCISERPPRLHQQLFDNRSQRVRREVGQGPHDQDDPNQQAHEQRARGGERPQSSGHDPLLDQRAAKGHDGDQEGEAADQHGEGPRPVVERRVAVDAGEGRPVVAVTRRVEIQDLREPMRAWIEDRANSLAGSHWPPPKSPESRLAGSRGPGPPS